MKQEFMSCEDLSSRRRERRSNQNSVHGMEEKPFLLIKGGRGGKGNAFFRNARRQAPRTAQEGEQSQTKKIILEMKWPSHLALIGLKGVGKSRLLSYCYSYLKSQANIKSVEQNKPANFYHSDGTLEVFPSYKENMKHEIHALGLERGSNPIRISTPRVVDKLYPQLFVLHQPRSYKPLVVVDLPELTLRGHKFLRQAERTQTLLFVISLEDTDPFLSYQQLLKILKLYDTAQKTSLLKKNSLLLLKGERTAKNIKKEQAFKQVQKLSFFSEKNPEDINKLLYTVVRTE